MMVSAPWAFLRDCKANQICNKGLLSVMYLKELLTLAISTLRVLKAPHQQYSPQHGLAIRCLKVTTIFWV